MACFWQAINPVFDILHSLIQHLKRFPTRAGFLLFTVFRMDSLFRHAQRLVYLVGISVLATGARAEGFEDSTGGKTLESSGGLSQAEIQQLDAATRKQVEKFHQGRASSGANGNGRVSNVLEMHDSNYDGVTDHGNASNALEKGTENAALGNGSRMPSGDKRNAKLEEARVKACNGKKVNGACANISANIIDVGPAHLDKGQKADTEEHRVYEVTKGAKAGAEKAGAEYAKQVIQDGANYDPQGDAVNAPNNSKVQRVGKRGDKVRVQRMVNGQAQWVETDIAANPDLLRSEVAWLEDQKARNVQNGWKFLRAKKLSGGSKLDEDEMGDLVQSAYKGTSAKEIAEGDRIVAERIAQKQVLGGRLICSDGSAPNNKNECKTLGKDGKPESAQTVANLMSGNLSPDKKLLIQQRLNNAKLNPNDKKSVAERAAMVSACMKEDVWCNANGGNIETDRNGKPLDYAKDKTKDVGSTFTDTRELVYHQADKARKGSLNNAQRTMTNADFNSRNSQTYRDMQKQVQAAKAQSDQFLANERLREKQDPLYKSPYLRGGYNPGTMSATQLSGRNVQRGDASFMSRGPSSAVARDVAPAPGSPSMAPPQNSIPVPQTGMAPRQ